MCNSWLEGKPSVYIMCEFDYSSYQQPSPCDSEKGTTGFELADTSWSKIWCINQKDR